MTMQKPKDRNWWRSVGCHMSPAWNLSMSTTADEQKLKENIEIRLLREYAPDFMPIESVLFRAWLDVSSLRLQNSMQSLATALKYVKEAVRYLETKEYDEFAHVGYGTVVYSFLLWLHEIEKDEEEFQNAELKLLDLHKSRGSEIIGELHPSARAYVHATHAFALSRLGEEHLHQSVNLFKTALRRQPSNTNWQFSLAKILFRSFNMQKLATYGYRREPLSPKLEKKFKIVKTILENINQDNPNFHWVNVHLGYVLFFLNEAPSVAPHCKVLVNEALDHERNNIDVVLLAMRLYKQMKDFKRCFDLLESLPEHFRTAEVYFQLGILYYEQSKTDRRNQTELLHKSLTNIEKALKKDSCQFPALVKRADIYAQHRKLDENYPDKAKDFYRDVTSKCREKANKRNTFHATRSMTKEKVEGIFTPLKRVNNCYDHFVAIVEADEFAYRNEEGKLILSLEYKDYAQKVRDRFVEFSEYDDEKNRNASVRAKLYLAKCDQLIGEQEKAKETYEAILCDDKLDPLVEFDVKFGLAECYLSLGKYAEAEATVQQLKVNDMDTRKNKLLGDVYTSEAKQLQKQMKDKFAKAIDIENLEGCLEMLLANGNFCQDFFSVQERIAIILAKINICMKGENMQIVANVDSMGTVSINIKDKFDKLLIQPMTFPPLKQTILRDTFNSLSILRSALLEFECSLLCDETTSGCSTEEGSARCSEGQCERQRRESESWQTDCQSNAKGVLKKALSLFNQSIECLQMTLLSSEAQQTLKPNTAQFPIICWRNEDEADEFLASDDLQKLLVEQFPDDFEAYIPPDMFDYLLQIQPRVNKKNVWLEVLLYVVNNLKGDILPNDSYKYDLGNESDTQNFCTVHVARKSCEEAEKLVLTVLQRCQELLNQNNEKVGQFKQREE